MIYARIVLVVMALTALALIYHKGYSNGQDSKQAEWDKVTAEQRKVSSKQAEESRQKEKAQDETTRKLQSKYSQARADLDVALGRLRDVRLCDVGDLPREDGVRVAGSEEGSVSRDSKGSTGTVESSAHGATVTLGDALKDTLQCTTLIEWVKTQGLAQ